MYINSAQEFGRNTSIWKEWHKKTLYQKIFHIETPWNQLVYNYCYFRGYNISHPVLLLPLPTRWRWTRAPTVGRMSVDMLPGSQQVTSTPVHLYSCTLCKVCTTNEMNWESFKLGSKTIGPLFHLIRVHIATTNLNPKWAVEIEYYLSKNCLFVILESIAYLETLWNKFNCLLS